METMMMMMMARRVVDDNDEMMEMIVVVDGHKREEEIVLVEGPDHKTMMTTSTMILEGAGLAVVVVIGILLDENENVRDLLEECPTTTDLVDLQGGTQSMHETNDEDRPWTTRIVVDLHETGRWMIVETKTSSRPKEDGLAVDTTEKNVGSARSKLYSIYNRKYSVIQRKKTLKRLQ
jgi:hypothetical protein